MCEERKREKEKERERERGSMEEKGGKGKGREGERAGEKKKKKKKKNYTSMQWMDSISRHFMRERREICVESTNRCTWEYTLAATAAAAAAAAASDRPKSRCTSVPSAPSATKCARRSTTTMLCV